MTKEEIFKYFYTNSANFGAKELCLVLFAGLLLSLLIAYIYFLSTDKLKFNNKFSISLIIIFQISILIMLMISSNIVISLGMVGALSIVRFRTAIKDSRDTVFIFWAISEGLCVGSQNVKLALISTLFISIIILLSSVVPKSRNKYLIIVRGGKGVIDDKELRTALDTITNKYTIRSANKNDDHQEYIIEAKTKSDLTPNSLDCLLKIKNVKSANYVAESGETIG